MASARSQSTLLIGEQTWTEMPILLSRTVKIRTIDGADLVQVGRFLHTKLMRGYQRRTGQLASSRRGRIPSGVSGQDMAICFRIAMRSWVSSWYSRAVVTSAAGRWLFATSVRCACCPPTEHSVRLLRAAWGDRTSHLTDLSPSGAVCLLYTSPSPRD